MGIRYEINLMAGGAYMQRATYLREGHDESYYEVGAWSLADGGRTLLLESGRKGRTYWAVKDAGTLRKLDLEARPIESKLPYELSRRAGLQPMVPRVKLRGMFRYVADAPRFRDCRSGLNLPVAMSGDEYLALERDYTARRSKPGVELMVSLEARIEERPKMEGDGFEPTVVVEEFLSASPGERCEGDGPEYGIENNRWRPVRIGERAVQVAEGEREPWFVLDPRSKRVTGSGGCNRIHGTYEAGAGTLRFGPLAATMMACPAMETETTFLRALQETRRYRLNGRTLDLMDDRGRRLVRLEERNLR
jgi:copper homeostasis protein (lipoprotein)